jgi:hypothetical protein
MASTFRGAAQGHARPAFRRIELIVVEVSDAAI